jgi:hypothetical protein
MADVLKNLPNSKATRLDNITCVYCGSTDNADNPHTDEHVVGRRFVPKGSFVKGWSLIVRSCQQCNNEKSDLEDDISAITLQPELGGSHESADLAAQAQRKAAGSFSRRTKKLVQDSHVEDTIEGTLMSSVKVSFKFIGPPQLVPERARRLAWMHLQAFFYLITYNAEQRTGGFIPGDIGFAMEASRSDWGNPTLRGFAELTKTWPPRVIGTGADGFFKIAIRREPAGSLLWSFALEWNAKYRIVGFFGEGERVQKHLDELPPLKWKRVDATWRQREEIALDPSDDILFTHTVANE